MHTKALATLQSSALESSKLQSSTSHQENTNNRNISHFHNMSGLEENLSQASEKTYSKSATQGPSL